MIRRRGAFGGGTSRHAADLAVGRGMADVLAALDTVIDDDAALARTYAAVGPNLAGAAPGRSAGAPSDEACARTGRSGLAITTTCATGTAASRRRLALRSLAGLASVAAAGGLALAVVVVPGEGRGGTEGPSVDTAYVVTRVATALSAAGPGDIAQMTVTTSSAAAPGGETATTTAEQWSYGHQWRSVTESPAGHPAYDEGFSTSALYTLVNYQTRTWARQPGPGHPTAPTPDPHSCTPAVLALFQLGPPGLGSSASSLPAASALRTAITCGTLTDAGRQHIDGIEAIELTSRPNSKISETIWVSPGTYLPVRVVVRSAPGQPVRQRTADISWLQSTAQNLANLTVPIPAGFRQVPFAEAVQSVSQQAPRAGRCGSPGEVC
ncbi:MAG TPA: hypothetical protein VIY52_25895 [Streptosporangiaceae bacterium]